jgi:hypothetical protein
MSARRSVNQQTAKAARAQGSRRQGEIRSATLPVLFHEYSAARATGLLTVTDHDIRKTVQFGEGHVLFASSNDRDDRFNQVLLKNDAIALKNLLKAIEVSLATKDRLGEVLVGWKMLKPADVEKWIKAQVREIILGLFSWTRGQYSFEEKMPASETIIVGVPADLMAFEGVKCIGSWARVYEQVGGLNSEYRTTKDAATISRDLPLSAEEKELLRLCDQPTSLDEMCEASALGDYEVCRSVWALLVVGALMRS